MTSIAPEPCPPQRAELRWRSQLAVANRYCLSVLVLALAFASPAASIDRDALIASAAQLPRLHNLLVSVDGELVLEHHQAGPRPDQPANIKSLSKTVLAAMVGMAIKNGVFESVDQPITDLLGTQVPDDATPGVQDITVSHLLSLQAGLERTSGRNYGRWVVSDNWVEHVLTRPFVDQPGGRMLYSTGSSHLLSAALTEASGRSTLALARDWLGEPLNITIPAWPQDPQGIYFGGNDMLLSPRALIRVGELHRLDGQWNAQQLLPAGWVEQAWQGRGRSAFTDDPYGYGWFQLELRGYNAWYGRGFGGQMLYVVPELKLTVAVTSNPNPPSPGSRYLRQLHALLENHVIPGLGG